MMTKYDDLDRDSLIRLLQRRDAQRQLGLAAGNRQTKGCANHER